MPRLLGKRLSPAQLVQFQNALMDAFNATGFDNMLQLYVGQKREHLYFGNTDMPDRVLGVINALEDRSWTSQLLLGALRARPDDLGLQEFASQFGLAYTSHSKDALERIIHATHSMLDVHSWVTRLTQLIPQVCRISYSSGSKRFAGTGFLVAPDIVMTNFHIMEEIFDHSTLAQKVRLTFDFKETLDGATLFPGTRYRLAQNWDFDHSRYSDIDTMINPGDAEPELEQLDYALLCVNGTPGNDPISGSPDTSRGWIRLPDEEYDFMPKTPLSILQYPGIPNLMLAIETDGIIETNHNLTRVRYSTNTERGSSGAPCFSAEWELIALHHCGDPNYEEFHKPQYNQGIPIMMIRWLLEKRGKLALLTSQ